MMIDLMVCFSLLFLNFFFFFFRVAFFEKSGGGGQNKRNPKKRGRLVTDDSFGITLASFGGGILFLHTFYKGP